MCSLLGLRWKRGKFMEEITYMLRPLMFLKRNFVLKYLTALVINMYVFWKVTICTLVLCTDFPVVSVTNLVRMYRLSYCLGHQCGTYVPTFLLSRSPIWYVCTDFPIVSVTSLVRIYRLPSPVMMYGTSEFHWK